MLDYVYLHSFDLVKICLGENAKIEQFGKVSKFLHFIKDYTNIHPKTVSDLVNVLFKDKLLFFFHTDCKILSFIPATSPTAERLFSTHRWLKLYLRSTMGQIILSSITIINIEISYANRILQ